MQLRIGTYNIRHGSEKGRYLDQIADLIASQNLDIVGLQEVDYMIARSGKEDTLKKIADRAGYPYYQFFKAIDYQDGEYGLGIISRYPFHFQKRTFLPNCVYEKRILVEVQVEIGSFLLAFFNTHLDLGSFEAVRKAQFACLNQELKDRNPFVLVGDFNVTDWTKAVHHFEWDSLEGVNCANSVNNPLYTFQDDRSPHRAPIDNIITNAAYPISDICLHKEQYSDHLLLTCTIQF
jgi:endonuclease/exonuclease/phosphatase family metal-dependent hydrolase